MLRFDFIGRYYFIKEVGRLPTCLLKDNEDINVDSVKDNARQKFYVFFLTLLFFLSFLIILEYF